MTETIDTRDARYALDLVKRICAEVGPGLPGTSQERQRAAILKKELEMHLGAENVTEEEFTLAPDAFLSTLPGVICLLAAIILNLSVGRLAGFSAWMASLGAVAFSILMPLLFVLEFALSLEVIDPLFPKKQSTNVVGRLRKPGTRDVRRVLILSGHHDSALELTWLRLFGKGFFVLSAIFVVGTMTLVVLCLIQLVGLILGSAAVVRSGTLGWGPLVFLMAPAIIYALFLTRGRRNSGVVPGAADNLSACAAVAAMSRLLARHPEDLPECTGARSWDAWR